LEDVTIGLRVPLRGDAQEDFESKDLESDTSGIAQISDAVTVAFRY
jgi:hypothetical protein